ncbi:hypothetical protein M8818_004197 [Zalaria obscura]|uniref:Uncharacterized protein n=1 Tax=Zalaria obscura TaxID=2024903 RepID=A0ACC3SCK3_9PEZI
MESVRSTSAPKHLLRCALHAHNSPGVSVRPHNIKSTGPFPLSIPLLSPLPMFDVVFTQKKGSECQRNAYSATSSDRRGPVPCPAVIDFIAFIDPPFRVRTKDSLTRSLRGVSEASGTQTHSIKSQEIPIMDRREWD